MLYPLGTQVFQSIQLCNVVCVGLGMLFYGFILCLHVSQTTCLPYVVVTIHTILCALQEPFYGLYLTLQGSGIAYQVTYLGQRVAKAQSGFQCVTQQSSDICPYNQCSNTCLLCLCDLLWSTRHISVHIYELFG